MRMDATVCDSRWGAVVAVMVGMALLPLAALANLLANPGMENGDLSGWSTWGSNVRASDWPGDQHNGMWGCVIDVFPTDSDEWRGLFQMIPVTEGVTYEHTAWLRAAAVESGVTESFLELQWFNNSGSLIEQWQSTHVVADQDWTLMGSNTYIAPAGAVTASVRFIVHQTSGLQPTTTDWHMVDDMVFQEAIPEPGVLGLAGLGLMLLSRLRRR